MVVLFEHVLYGNKSNLIQRTPEMLDGFSLYDSRYTSGEMLPDTANEKPPIIGRNVKAAINTNRCRSLIVTFFLEDLKHSLIGYMKYSYIIISLNMITIPDAYNN